MDIVKRLRSDQPCTQFNRAGVLENYNTTPSALDLEAADKIEQLHDALHSVMLEFGPGTMSDEAFEKACTALKINVHDKQQ